MADPFQGSSAIGSWCSGMICYVLMMMCLLSPIVLGWAGVLFSLPALVGLFFGGMILNAAALGPCVVPCFFVFVVAVPGAITLDNWINQSHKKILYAGSICDYTSWPTQDGPAAYIQFDDASLGESDERALFPTITMKHGDWTCHRKGCTPHWEALSIEVQPVYTKMHWSSTADNKPCAWAIGKKTKGWHGCDQSGGLCASVRTKGIPRLFNILPMCDQLENMRYYSNDVQDRYKKMCRRSGRDFIKNWTLAASREGVQLDVNAPFIDLEDRSADVVSSWWAVTMWMKAVALYVPVPLTILCITKGLRKGSFTQAIEVAEASSHPSEVARGVQYIAI